MKGKIRSFLSAEGLEFLTRNITTKGTKHPVCKQCNVSWCHLRQEDQTETPYQKDCDQGLAHVRKDLFSVHKWAFKYDIKLMLYKTLIRLVMTYACPIWKYAEDAHLLKLNRPKKSTPRYWKFQQAHSGPPIASGFQNSLCVRLYK
jgi:hypothetical protein